MASRVTYRFYDAPESPRSFPLIIIDNDNVYYKKYNTTYLSRYNNKYVIKDDEILEIEEDDIKNLDIEYTTHVVTSKEKNRLDIVALNEYNVSQLWWVIALFNDIEDAFNIEIGTELMIPELLEVQEEF